MSNVLLTQKDRVYLLELTNGDGDNSLNLDVLAEWNRCLDQVQAAEGNLSLLVYCKHPKTFCTGIDLEWLLAQPQETQTEFITQLDNLLIRLATISLPVVFAINGNCYAGGALLASTADFRYMRADKGRFCFPEVKIKMAFTPTMLEIVKLLPNLEAQYELSLTADAWGGEKCEEQRVVTKAVAAEEVFETAFQQAKTLSEKDRKTYGKIKQGLRGDLVSLAKQRGLA